MGVKCKVCNKDFSTNKTGWLTRHIMEEHNLTLEQYVIDYDLDGVEPKCKCGLCDERPVFYRGVFKRYAKNHNTFDFRKKKFIEKNGQPVCANPKCNSETSWRRGKPTKYCSTKCNEGAFHKSEVQQKIAKVVQEKYGVDNVSHIPEVRAKISKKLAGKKRSAQSQETRRKISAAVKARWEEGDYRQKVTKEIKEGINNNPKELQNRSARMKQQWEDESFLQKMYDGLADAKCFSKLHIKIRNQLDLESLGFVGEQRVGRYRVDELNEESKVIIEINGDYIHANPKLYKAEDIIRLRGSSYTAEEKWNSDKKKLDKLKEMGYNVITIWESDDYEEKLKEILSRTK